MGIEIMDQLNGEQINDLHRLFQSEWWTKGRSLSDVKRMIENSDCIIGLWDTETEKLIGFTRVLTDYVYKALVLDVIVSTSYRGKDLGRLLIDTVLETPSLSGVKHFELYCRPEMLPFYKKWGFTEDLGQLHFMRKMNEKS